MGRTDNLHKAKETKNDEFYTQYTDVSEEMKHYKQHFKDKVVLCNCDNPAWSAFWKYFHLNFTALGLKKLVSTYYDKTEPVYKTEYAGGNDSDILAGKKTRLNGNGDFSSRECLEILGGADIVVSNPPSSLERAYIITLTEYAKQFLIVGDVNQIKYKDIFPLFKENKVWLGNNAVKEFIQPDGTIRKFGNKLWFTNLDHKKRHEELVLRKKYNPTDYPKYVNFDAIDVKSIADIPMDYEGLIGCPVTILQYFNPEQFELVGCPGYKGKYGRDAMGIKGLGEEWLNAYRKQGGTGNYTANMAVPVYFDANGIAKAPFSRVIIRKKAVD